MSRVVTVTLNPALDVSTSAEVVSPVHKLRCEPARREAGGGGVNVARVASRLGIDATAIVVVGGSVGTQLVGLIEDEGIPVVAVEQSGETRECFAVAERSTGQQYRFVTPGPELEEATVDLVARSATEAIDRHPATAVTVVISGSVPPGTRPGVIDELVNSLQPYPVIVDTSGPGLIEALNSPAALVKPSARELQSVVGQTLASEADVLAAAVDVFEQSSAGALVVSIGAGGAFLLSADSEPLRLRAPTVKVESAIGAGDSMVAGIAVGLARGLSLPAAAEFGIAAGTATVMTPGTGLCSPGDVEALEPMVVTERCR